MGTTELTRTPLTDRTPPHLLRVTTWVPSATLEAPAFARATHTLGTAARLTGAALTQHQRNTCLETSTTWSATSLVLRLRFRCAQQLLCRAKIRAKWFSRPLRSTMTTCRIRQQMLSTPQQRPFSSLTLIAIIRLLRLIS